MMIPRLVFFTAVILGLIVLAFPHTKHSNFQDGKNSKAIALIVEEDEDC